MTMFFSPSEVAFFPYPVFSKVKVESGNKWRQLYEKWNAQSK